MNNITLKIGLETLTVQNLQHLVAVNTRKHPLPTHQTPTENIGYYALFPHSSPPTPNTLPVYSIQGYPTKLIPTGTLYITFKKGINRPQQTQLLRQHHLHLLERLDATACIVQCNPHTDPVQLTQILLSTPHYHTVEPDFAATVADAAFAMPTDELIPTQWYLKNDGEDRIRKGDKKPRHWAFRRDADAKVIEAWQVLGNLGSDKITIAIVDRGFDINHPDFANKIVAPRDFRLENDPSLSEPFQIIIENDSEKLTSDSDHGTACAGIALASSTGQGIVGVAPNARFMPIRINTASTMEMRSIFRHAMRNGCDILSCSFGILGKPMDSLLIRTIRNCATRGRNGKGCIICFATGNDYSILQNNEVATHPYIIAVGASTSEDEFAPYTNRSSNMSVVAPGGYGYSGTMVTSDTGMVNVHGEELSVGEGENETPYYRFNAEGTSFACPLVAGVCALVLSANPRLSAMEVKAIIERTADKIGHPSDYINGHSIKYGWGRINAANAVRMALLRPAVPFRGAEIANTRNLPVFRFNWGQTIQAELGPNELELLLKYPVLPTHQGKNLSIELDVPLDHIPEYKFQLFIRKNQSPVFDQGLYEDSSAFSFDPEDNMSALHLFNIEPATYHILVRCFDSKNSEYIRGGGKFEVTFTIDSTPIA